MVPREAELEKCLSWRIFKYTMTWMSDSTEITEILRHHQFGLRRSPTNENSQGGYRSVFLNWKTNSPRWEFTAESSP
jgi:hypothetical protein